MTFIHFHFQQNTNQNTIGVKQGVHYKVSTKITFEINTEQYEMAYGRKAEYSYMISFDLYSDEIEDAF